MAELNDLDKRIIQTLAVCDLKPTEASRVLYMHRNTVIHHIEKIYLLPIVVMSESFISAS